MADEEIQLEAAGQRQLEGGLQDGAQIGAEAGLGPPRLDLRAADLEPAAGRRRARSPREVHLEMTQDLPAALAPPVHRPVVGVLDAFPAPA